MRLLLFLSIFGFSKLFAQETNTAMGVTLNPEFSIPRYVSDGTYSAGLIDTIRDRESGKLGLSGHFFFQYKLSDRIYIDWGLGMQYYGYQSSVSTPMSEVTFDSNYSQYYLRFQASGKFRLYRTLYARIGAGINILAESHYRTIQTTPSGEQKTSGLDNRNFKEAMGVATFGIGYEMKVGEKINLVTEFYGSSGFTPSTGNESGGTSTVAPLDRVPYQIGISLGLIRYF